MANPGLKQNTRRRDLCHFEQSLSKVPPNVFFSHSFNPDLGTLHGTLILQMPPTSVQCATWMHLSIN